MPAVEVPLIHQFPADHDNLSDAIRRDRTYPREGTLFAIARVDDDDQKLTPFGLERQLRDIAGIDRIERGGLAVVRNARLGVDVELLDVAGLVLDADLPNPDGCDFPVMRYGRLNRRSRQAKDRGNQEYENVVHLESLPQK